jgi:hypothetical protein
LCENKTQQLRRLFKGSCRSTLIGYNTVHTVRRYKNETCSFFVERSIESQLWYIFKLERQTRLLPRRVDSMHPSSNGKPVKLNDTRWEQSWRQTFLTIAYRQGSPIWDQDSLPTLSGCLLPESLLENWWPQTSGRATTRAEAILPGSDGKLFTGGNFHYDVRASFFTYLFFTVISMFGDLFTKETFTVLSMFFIVLSTFRKTFRKFS